jgi:hypothetical protein
MGCVSGNTGSLFHGSCTVYMDCSGPVAPAMPSLQSRVVNILCFATVVEQLFGVPETMLTIYTPMSAGHCCTILDSHCHADTIKRVIHEHFELFSHVQVTFNQHSIAKR